MDDASSVSSSPLLLAASPLLSASSPLLHTSVISSDSPVQSSVSQQDEKPKRRSFFPFYFGLRRYAESAASDSKSSLEENKIQSTPPMESKSQVRSRSPSPTTPLFPQASSPESNEVVSHPDESNTDITHDTSKPIQGRKRSEEIKPVHRDPINDTPPSLDSPIEEQVLELQSPESMTRILQERERQHTVLVNHSRIASFFQNYADVPVMPDGTAITRRERKIKFAAMDDIIDDEEEIESKAQIEIQREYELERQRRESHRGMANGSMRPGSPPALSPTSADEDEEEDTALELARPTTADTITTMSDFTDLSPEDRRDLEMIAYELSEERLGANEQEISQTLASYGMDPCIHQAHQHPCPNDTHAVKKSSSTPPSSSSRKSVRHIQIQTESVAELEKQQRDEREALGIAPPIPPKDDRRFSPPSLRQSSNEHIRQLNLELSRLRADNAKLEQSLKEERQRLVDETQERQRVEESMNKLRARYDKVSAQAYLALKRLVEDKRRLEAELGRTRASSTATVP